MIRKRYLFLILAVLVLGISLTYIFAEIKSEEYEEMQVDAAKRMEESEKYLKEIILSKGIEIEEADINKTALLGPEFTELTSTPGEESAKRSALNPQFASALIRYYHEAGLKKGDTIAVGATGSFPGFVIATLTSATTMGLKVKLIASVGSSMHGATRTSYTIFDIVNDLKEGGFADFDLVGVSCGSANDKGGGVLEDIFYTGSAELSRELCVAEAKKTGAEFIYKDTLAESIQRRLELYGDDIKLFVNVGGASVNSGVSTYAQSFPRGLVLDPPKLPKSATMGLNYEFASRGIPVINLLSVKQLCQDNGILFDPVPLPSMYRGEKLEKVECNKGIAIATLSIALAILILGIIDSKKRLK